MSRSIRTTPINVDSAALTRLIEVAKETGLYDSRRAAENDSYEEVIHLLVDRFQAEPESLREAVSTKYEGGDA